MTKEELVKELTQVVVDTMRTGMTHMGKDGTYSEGFLAAQGLWSKAVQELVAKASNNNSETST